jgi:translation elongation factor EF-4
VVPVIAAIGIIYYPNSQLNSSSIRLLELTNTIRDRGSNKQVLDKLKVERDRGITVKAQVFINDTMRIGNILLNAHAFAMVDCFNVL